MFEKCPNCKGEGEVKILGMKTLCPACKGAKGFDVPKGKKICPTCKGTSGTFGPSGAPCKECHGTKFVDKK